MAFYLGMSIALCFVGAMELIDKDSRRRGLLYIVGSVVLYILFLNTRI